MLPKKAFPIDTVEGCIFTIPATSLLLTTLPDGPLAAAQARKISSCFKKAMRSLGRILLGRPTADAGDAFLVVLIFALVFGFARSLAVFSLAGGFSPIDVTFVPVAVISNLPLMFGFQHHTNIKRRVSSGLPAEI